MRVRTGKPKCINRQRSKYERKSERDREIEREKETDLSSIEALVWSCLLWFSIQIPIVLFSFPLFIYTNNRYSLYVSFSLSLFLSFSLFSPVIIILSLSRVLSPFLPLSVLCDKLLPLHPPHSLRDTPMKTDELYNF